MNLDNLEKNEKIKGQNEGIPPDFEPRKNDTIKGHFIGSKHPISSGHSDPITIDINNSLYNNKLLEGDTGDFQSPFTSPSPTSSNDDFRNELLAENSFVSVAPNGALSDPQSDSSNEENNMAQNRNQKNDEITEWFNTQINPIKRYEYELKYTKSAKYYAWGNQCLAELQKDYYTPEEIFEWFSKEDKLWYLKKINWEHCNNQNRKRLIDISVEPINKQGE
jgi:hypothetical protein